MAESTVTKWAIISLVVGTLLGSGSIWQLMKFRLEAQKNEVERIMKTTDLRKQEAELYAKIIELTNEYIKAIDQYSKNSDPQLNTRILQLAAQLQVIKEDFISLEGNLSHLEGREPRRLILEFFPPNAPTGLSVQ